MINKRKDNGSRPSHAVRCRAAALLLAALLITPAWLRPGPGAGTW